VSLDRIAPTYPPSDFRKNHALDPSDHTFICVNYFFGFRPPCLLSGMRFAPFQFLLLPPQHTRVLVDRPPTEQTLLIPHNPHVIARPRSPRFTVVNPRSASRAVESQGPGLASTPDLTGHTIPSRFGLKRAFPSSFVDLRADIYMVPPYVVLFIGHVSLLSLRPSPSLPFPPSPHHLPLGLWTPYHTSVALPFLPPTNPYIRSLFPTPLYHPLPILSSILCVHSIGPCSTLHCPNRGLVCSNPVAPFTMVSDPMDAPYGTDAHCVIQVPLFSFSEAPNTPKREL